MGTYLVAGGCIVLTAIILMSRINLKRFMGYPNIVDILFTLFIMYEFAGTFSGAAAAAMAGIFMSVTLWVIRCTIGAERLSWKRGRFGLPALYWRVIPPTDIQPHWMLKWFRFFLTPKEA